MSQPMQATVFSHKTTEYYTPQHIIEAARHVLGAIELDPASCAASQKTVKAAQFFTKEQNGLLQEWRGKVWLNPPYSKTRGKSNQAIWAERLIIEYKEGNVPEGLLLVKAALGYIWFENLFDKWPVCFVRKRLSFTRSNGDNTGQSKQGTAIFYLGENLDNFIKHFSCYGRIVLPEETTTTNSTRNGAS